MVEAARDDDVPWVADHVQPAMLGEVREAEPAVLVNEDVEVARHIVLPSREESEVENGADTSKDVSHPHGSRTVVRPDQDRGADLFAQAHGSRANARPAR